MDLQQEIDARRSEIRTDSYAMSVGEWISLYEHKELDIHPEFQHFFHWDVWQKSRFIESILLGIPIPSIFVLQRNDGVWDVIDGNGLQRLATIFQFVGILKDERGDLVPPLSLVGTDDLPSLKDVVWNSEILQQKPLGPTQEFLREGKNVTPKSLTQDQRMLIRRAKIQVSIILKESNEKNKYELFQRLNMGETSFSNQELRNCILASINYNMYEWLRQISHDENFMNCVNLTDKAISEQYNLELVLRFLIFRDLDSADLKNIGDLDDFLTKRMRKIATSEKFDEKKEERYFKETFELLAKTTKDNSFRRYDDVKGRFVGGFLVSAFEMVALGVGYNLDLIRNQQIDIENKGKGMWKEQEFIKNADKNASARISKVIPLGRRLFKP